jgi:hypothetical protein
MEPDTIPDLGLKPIDTNTINSPHPTVNEILSGAAASSYDGLGTNAPSEVQNGLPGDQDSTPENEPELDDDGREIDIDSEGRPIEDEDDGPPVLDEEGFEIVESDEDDYDGELTARDSYEERVDRLAGNNNRGYERTHGWHDDECNITTTVYYRNDTPLAVLIEDLSFGEEVLVPTHVLRQLLRHMEVEAICNTSMAGLGRQRS